MSSYGETEIIELLTRIAESLENLESCIGEDNGTNSISVTRTRNG